MFTLRMADSAEGDEGRLMMFWIWLIFAGFMLFVYACLPDSKVKFERRDMWIGVFFGEFNTYVCLVPFIVFIIKTPEYILRRRR